LVWYDNKGQINERESGSIEHESSRYHLMTDGAWY